MKKINFPENEIPELIRRNRIITHRVLDDFGKYAVGDVVVSPWERTYSVIERTEIGRIGESPYADQLTPAQLDYLKLFDDIAVFVLQAVDSGDGVEFRSLTPEQAMRIIQDSEAYADNERLDYAQFDDYFDESNMPQVTKMWYGIFKDGVCTALSTLWRIPAEDIILFAEIQSFVKGYGKPLIENTLSRSRNIWWCADPDGGESLVDYYRQFGLKEHLIKMSKWTNTPEYAFYKAEDEEHETTILDNLEKAEK